MLVGEIIILCIIFLMLPPVIWRLIYLGHKTKYDKFIAQVDALNKLQSTLNATLNSVGGNSSAPTAELIKKMKVKKSKIIEKLDALMELISSRIGVPIIHESIMDNYMQEKVIVKLFDESHIRGRSDSITGDFMFLRRILYELIKENKFPVSEDFDSINKIYKAFKKMPKVKK